MDVRGYLEANAREFFGALKHWLAIPSVSADPARHGGVRRSAEWLAGHLRTLGFPVAEVWDTAGSGPEADLAEILGAPPVFVGVGLDSDRMHAPNERVDMALLLRGAEACAYLWDELAGIRADLT
jgi:acetylornithine deacetylase/succinyl-diaminopimelate desuccinylase-like protein